MSEQQTRPTFLVPAEDYKQIVERLDEATISQAFIGRYESREAFGLHLLDDTSAKRRLAELPPWLRPYVRLDGEALVTDLESTGVYVIAPVESGICVFDAPAVRTKE
jgi:hypothetical protein